MNIDHLNSLSHEAFVDQVGWVFEHSPWVAERAWLRRPFAGLDALHRAMCEEVRIASHEEQLALLRAHPDLGARARMSDASVGEQAGAGLDQLTPEEFAQLERLNLAYRERFGFPFLYAVKGSTKYDVLRALDERGKGSLEPEFDVALEQVYRIAKFRLEA